jgi:hypothetical protein
MTVFYKTLHAPFAHHRRMKKALLILTFPLWMAGSWRLDDRGTRVEEVWTNANGNLMLGMSKTVTAKGKVNFEFVRIAEVDGKLAYIAQPQGQPLTTFPLKSLDATRVVFENLKHDFPQRILYWRKGEQLCARIEGNMGGKVEGEEWCYSAVH